MIGAANENGPSGGEPGEPQRTANTNSNRVNYSATAPDDARLMAVADVPDGPASAWVAVYRDRNDGLHWLRTADGELVNVGHDAVGNWVTRHGEVQVFARDGTVIRPADDPIDVPDLEAESIVLELAAKRLRTGRGLDIAEEARVELARRRLRAWDEIWQKVAA